MTVTGSVLTDILPLAAPQVPQSGELLMPERADSFAEGLGELVSDLMVLIAPSLSEGVAGCMRIAAVALLLGILRQLPGAKGKALDAAGAAALTVLLMEGIGEILELGFHTVQEISSYGKLLLGVMASAMAAQGAVTSSGALYAGTAAFDNLLCSLLTGLLGPLLRIYLAICAAKCALGENVLKKMAGFIKGLSVWTLKTMLYLFTGYISITGVVSGATDAAALKAAKITISGVVPVVGGILSDASEAVLVSASVARSAAGIYGILALLAVFGTPFVKIGVRYLLINLTCAICGLFDTGPTVELLEDFSGAMGLVLAMTGSVCLLHLISTVCFLRGVG